MPKGSFRELAVVACVSGSLVSLSPAAAACAPRLLAPAAGQGVVEVQTPCPSFHWSGVDSAEAYELVLYRVAVESDEPRELYRIQLPSDVRSWTASAERCLKVGKRFAWSVLAKASPGLESWSEVSVFRVAPGPTVAEVERALAVLREYVAAESKPSELEAARPPVVSSTERGVELGTPLSLSGSTLGARPRETKLLSLAPAMSESPSMVLDEQIHLGSESEVFKEGQLFLWDDPAGGNLGIGRYALGNTTAGGNTAVGQYALFSNTLGESNTAVGRQALAVNQNGDDNTAVGDLALGFNTSGYGNTAIGTQSLAKSNGVYNTAMGLRALYSNTAGAGNTAVGKGALFFNTIGTDNIAIGQDAGSSLGRDGGSGGMSYNIFIGNSGQPTDNGTIRLGSGLQAHAFLAGKVSIGSSTDPSFLPESQLVVKSSVDGTATDPADNVVWIENTDTGGGGDVLALKIGEPGSLEASNNFITFLNGDNESLGAIEGDGAGGVTTASSGADYAEYLERLELDEEIAAGDVVGLFGRKISKRTAGADRVMVISTAPIVLGNDPGPGRRDRYERVAFVGQTPVRTRGPVRAGDVLLASERGDGTVLARAPDGLEPGELPRVVGRALETSDAVGDGKVRVLVGVPDPALAGQLLLAAGRELAELRLALAGFEGRLTAGCEGHESPTDEIATLAARLAALERRVYSREPPSVRAQRSAAAYSTADPDRQGR